LQWERWKYLNIMISAGEASGDVYGAYLAEKLIQLSPGVRLSGVGGAKMKEKGVEILKDPTALSTIGFTEVLANLSVYRKVFVQAAKELDRISPNCLVLIDFPEFNMRLAKRAARKGIPGVYLFPPTAWAWRKGRAKALARLGTTIASVVPIEADTYRKAGADVRFVGHPLLDLVSPGGPREKESARRELGLDAEEVISILPGSRDLEIKTLLPTMLQAAALIKEARPGAGLLLPLSHTVCTDLVREYTRKLGLPVRIVEGATYRCMAASDVLIVASGTATMEAAIVGTPMVVLYKTSTPTYLAARLLVEIPHISWPNILAGRRIVPELLQHEAEPRTIARLVLLILENPSLSSEIRKNLAEARAKLGSPGALMRTAELVLEVAHT
jgi:lipid-A-disaccharide synthase